jgi:hypothetical protein
MSGTTALTSAVSVAHAEERISNLQRVASAILSS